jgi:tetratricopeptide (TPR) repeat protein
LTHAGDYQAAIDCYGARGKGQGVGAELALLERARLEIRALGDRAAALRSLDAYDRRFPGGALHREAALTRIDVLRALGNNEEARRAIAGVIDRVPERALQLSMLASRLAADAGDCEDARRHLARARRLGATAEKLETLESRCP